MRLRQLPGISPSCVNAIIAALHHPTTLNPARVARANTLRTTMFPIFAWLPTVLLWSEENNAGTIVAMLPKIRGQPTDPKPEKSSLKPPRSKNNLMAINIHLVVLLAASRVFILNGTSYHGIIYCPGCPSLEDTCSPLGTCTGCSDSFNSGVCHSGCFRNRPSASERNIQDGLYSQCSSKGFLTDSLSIAFLPGSAKLA